MKIKPLIRDLGILVLFCVGFFLVTKSINLLGEENLEPVQVEFSETRRMADRHVNRKDYNSAIRFLTKLTEDDEFDSHAWFRLGACYALRYEQSKRPSLADPTPYSKDSRRQQKELADKAVAAFMHVVDYPRYRITAIQRISAIHVLEGNKDAALDILEKATEFETEIQNPRFILRDPFLVLADEPRFIEIKNRLLRNSRRYHRNRRSDRGNFGVAGSPGSSEQESGGTKK